MNKDDSNRERLFTWNCILTYPVFIHQYW